MQYSMDARFAAAIWSPGKVIVFVLLMMGLFQTSTGYVGTSDSTIFFFGQDQDGENGTKSDRILDVDVSILRSTSCGGQTTVFLYENNTLFSSEGLTKARWMFTANDPEISSVSSISQAVLYSLAANGSLYGYGNNIYGVIDIQKGPIYDISEPRISPPRLKEDVRYCAAQTCLAFSNFAPGSISDEPVNHEPNIPLYKFIGGWGDLSKGHLGIDPPQNSTPHPGMFYNGPDLIVKKVSISVFFSVFILHNNTVLVSGGGKDSNNFVYNPPTHGPAYLYRPIVYSPSIIASEVKIVEASAAQSHVLLLSEDHRVFFFGSNNYFPSGIPDFSTDPSAYVEQVTEVPFGVLIPGDSIIQVRAQLFRSSVITKMGFVYIWGTTLGTPDYSIKVPTLENTTLQDRYAVRYLNQDDITKTTHDAGGSCILTRPRAGNCTGVPPTADYYCIGGLWTTRGGGNIENLTISSPIEIDGNLTITGPLVINPQSSISVTQCLSIGSIEIVKQQGDDTTSQVIISTGKHCPDISGTAVNVIITGDAKKCQKKTATLSKSESGGSFTYSAIFKTDDNGCKLWWIILVSVLGGVFVVVIFVILLVTFVKPIRIKVRPFWLRNHTKAN